MSTSDFNAAISVFYASSILLLALTFKNLKIMKEAQPISNDHIKAIVSFLPIFTSEGFQFGHWTSEKGYFPYFTLSPEAHAFYKALYDNGGSFRSIGVLGKTKQSDM